MDLLDADGNGEVTKEEFGEFFMRANNIDQEAFDKVWLRIDADGDGHLSFEELCTFYDVDTSKATEKVQARRKMSDDDVLEALQQQTKLADALKEEKAKREALRKAAEPVIDPKAQIAKLREKVEHVKMSENMLMQECELGAIPEVKALIEGGAKVRLEDEKNEMPIHKLAKHGAAPLIELCLSSSEYGDNKDMKLADLNWKLPTPPMRYSVPCAAVTQLTSSSSARP